MPDITELDELLKTLASILDEYYDNKQYTYMNIEYVIECLNDAMDPTWIRAWLDD